MSIDECVRHVCASHVSWGFGKKQKANFINYQNKFKSNTAWIPKHEWCEYWFPLTSCCKFDFFSLSLSHSFLIFCLFDYFLNSIYCRAYSTTQRKYRFGHLKDSHGKETIHSPFFFWPNIIVSEIDLFVVVICATLSPFQNIEFWRTHTPHIMN